MKRPLEVLMALLLVTAAYVGGMALAQNEQSESVSLKVGDPAPPLKVSEWVKGDAVNLDDVKGKKVVVIEFWATWCPPCRYSIPHLTELQEKYKDRDVLVVGISSEEAETVKSFVEQAGDKMKYHVAVDKDETTWSAYMEASGARGIPHAFIVNKEGKVAWQGHPMKADFEKTIEKLATPPKEETEKQTT